MGKLIIHAGQMKSSTTYIQKILSRNRRKLSESGLVYPGKSENHQILFYNACGSHIYWRNEEPDPSHKSLKQLSKKIKIEKDAGRDVLLSAEGLSSMNHEGVEFLYNALGGFDSVIFTIRSLHKTLPSAWQQTLKSGNSESLNEFFKHLEKDRTLLEGYWRTYAFGNIAEIWSSFSKVNAILLPNQTNSDNDSWKLFSKSLELNLSEEIEFPDEKMNSSISLNTARLMRSISISSAESGLNKREVARWFYNNFVLGSKVRGEKICPPEFYKEMLNEWNEKELDLLKKNTSSLICSNNIENDFKEYNGPWLNESSDIEVIKDYDYEVASHILNYYKK